MMIAACLAASLLPPGLPSGAEEAPRKLKLLVSVDMEGIAGVVSGDQLGASAFEYARFREFMTRGACAPTPSAARSSPTSA
jgi:D-amino peptidase